MNVCIIIYCRHSERRRIRETKKCQENLWKSVKLRHEKRTCRSHGKLKFFINWIELSSSILIMLQKKNEGADGKVHYKNSIIRLRWKMLSVQELALEFSTHTGLLCGWMGIVHMQIFDFSSMSVTLSRGIDEGQARQRLKNVPIIGAEFSIWLKTFTKRINLTRRPLAQGRASKASFLFASVVLQIDLFLTSDACTIFFLLFFTS